MGRPPASSIPRSPRLFRSRWLRWTWLAIACLTCLAYAPALKAPFVFDDEGSIGDNVEIQALWPSSIPAHPPFQSALSGRPVATFTFALNYAINERLGVDQRLDSRGPNKTIGYHIVNLLLHLLCGALLFGVVRRTFRRQSYDARWAAHADAAAIVVAALWLLHPIQSESLNYIVQRTEILVSTCYLGTIYASIRAWDAGNARARQGWYAVAILACLLGMGSKEVMISAPVMVVLYDRAFRLPAWRDVVSPKTGRPWFYLLLAVTSAWLIAQVAGGARDQTAGFHVGIPWYQYLYSQAWAILHYLRLVVWPHPLILDYGETPIHGWSGVPGLLLLTGFGVATVLAWTRASRWGWFGFLGAWFFLILAPSSSIVPISTEIAAERRIYLALAAVLVLLLLGGESLRRRWLAGIDRGRQRGIAIWASVLLALALATATFERSVTYRSGEAIWRGVTASAPDNPRGFDNLATALLHQDPPREAEADSLLRQAIALDSTYASAWVKRGLIAVRQQRLGDARFLFEHAVKTDPNELAPRAALGNVLVALGEPEIGITYLEPVVAIEPTGTALVDVANAYLAAGRINDAASALRFAARYDASGPDMLSATGAVMTEQGDAHRAVEPLDSAIAHDPASGLNLSRLSLALAKDRQPFDAAAIATQAVGRSAGEPRVYTLAARAMLLSGKRKEGDAYLAKAVQINPRDLEALTLLAQEAVAEGKRADAVDLLERALGVRANYAPARDALAQLVRGGKVR